MADLSRLRNDISEKWNIKTNGGQAITGDKLKGAMLDVIDTLNEVKTDQDVFNREKQVLSQGLENQGTQIQEQAEKLSELEGEITDITKQMLSVTSGIYLRCLNAVGAKASFTSAPTVAFATTTQPKAVSAGETFVLRTKKSLTSGYFNYVILDANDIVLEKDDVGTDDYKEYNIVIPEGGTKLYANVRTNENEGYLAKVVNGGSKIEKLGNRIDALDASKAGFPSTMVEIEPTTIVEGKLINKSRTESSNSVYSYAILDVSEGEKYAINAFSTNSDYCGAFTIGASTSVLLSGTAKIYTEQEITIPQGATKLYVNVRTDQVPMLFKKSMKMSQEEFESSFSSAVSASASVKYTSRKQLCAMLYASGGARVYIHRYTKDKDLCFGFSRKAVNNLPDFSAFATLENLKEQVSTNPSAPLSYIVQGATDFLSPSIIYAENNADGDYPNFTAEHFTGGWHGHAGGTQTGGASARNVSFGISVDGEDVEIGTPLVGNVAVMTIVNRLQGSNTAKADGSGREIMEQKFTITFDARETKCHIKCEITALEDMRMSLHYGLSMYTNNNTAPAYFVGCRANRGVSLFSSVSGTKGCGDKYCYAFKQILGENVFEYGVDTAIDLGLQYANNSNNSCIQAPLKSYMTLVSKGSMGESGMLRLNAGDKAYWEGYYAVYPLAE